MRTNYYRTHKAGTGSDATTKAKLDAIDKMDATSTGGLVAPPTPGAAAGQPEGGVAAHPTPAQDAGHTTMADVHRMNF